MLDLDLDRHSTALTELNSTQRFGKFVNKSILKNVESEIYLRYLCIFMICLNPFEMPAI